MDIEERDYEGYVRRIEQIDKILQGPIESLVEIAVKGLKSRKEKEPIRWKCRIHIPSSIAAEPEYDESQLNTALCCSTLQRVWLHRRRFPKLERKLEALQKELKEHCADADADVLELLAQPFLPVSPGQLRFRDLFEEIVNTDGGPFDSYTASQVFWVLLHSGERNTHTAAGFFTFFTISWSLLGRFHAEGAVASGQASPTAYLTSRCLAPLFILRSICGRRAALLEEIGKLVHALVELMESGDKRRRGEWLPLRLDELSGKLYELSNIAVSREGFRRCAKEIEEVADGLQVGSDTGEAWTRVVQSLLQALRTLGTVSDQGLSEAKVVVEEFLPQFVEVMTLDGPEYRAGMRRLGFRVKRSAGDSGKEDRRRHEQAPSASKALEVCQVAFAALQRVSGRCLNLPDIGADIEGTLKVLCQANREVADKIEKVMTRPAQWCEVVLTREVAYASARNLTEFDPAELLSALFVVSAHKPDTSLRITDAIGKALVGMREDGSWIPGQPFFVERDLGIWAPTSDIVWMLSSIIGRYPDVRIADEALGAYVDWMERTRRTLRLEEAAEGEDSRKLTSVHGWISERNLRASRIDVWATTFAVRALLGIRELMEFRLWQLCERRFTTFEPSRRLIKIDAVDLGAIHSHRLHRRLARMARQAAGDDYKDAEYSLILHGPPGSSKTAITEALAMEMWRSSPSGERRKAHLIRITPADFTRKGEDRLDSEARIIFDVLGRVRGVTVLFDEIDDLLRIRDSRGDASFFKLVVPAMLNRLQDLREACPRQEICFVLATNYVDRIEPALMRKGRIDASIPLVYPDRESRRCTLGKRVAELRQLEKSGTADWAGWAAGLLDGPLGGEVISETDYWPWKAFDTFCQTAPEELREVWRSVKEEDRDVEALQRVRRQLRQASAVIPKRVYDSSRKERLRASAALQNELLQYSFAGAEDMASLLTHLFGHIRDIDGTDLQEVIAPFISEGKLRAEAAKALEIVLGEDLEYRMSEILQWRGWTPEKVEISA